MPNLMLGVLAREAAKTRFRGFNITLPAVQGAKPAIAALPRQSLQQSVARSAGSGTAAPPPAATPMQFPPALFRAASKSAQDVNNQHTMHDRFDALFDAIIDAIEYGFNQYRRTAGLSRVMINGCFATGGRLDGPALDGLIKSAPPVAGLSGWEGLVRDAVAAGLSHQWATLANSVMVPGLPWYPAFAAFPGPMAPPMPNTPTPFANLAHDGMAMSPFQLKEAMRSALQGRVDYSLEFFESIGAGLQMPLQIWKSSQIVMNVMGKGPVPSFAPPYVPVGPVVMGDNLPGLHIAS